MTDSKSDKGNAGEGAPEQTEAKFRMAVAGVAALALIAFAIVAIAS